TFKTSHTYSISASNMPLRELLNLVIQGLPVKYYIDGKTIFFTQKLTNTTIGQPNTASQEPPPVRIRVIDSAGIPLPGASVLNKNTNVSGVTDGDGFISLNASEGDVLLVSYVGMEPQTIKLSQSNLENGTLAIMLQYSISALATVEVSVSTGYQT